MRINLFGYDIYNSAQKLKQEDKKGDSGKSKSLLGNIEYQQLYRSRQDIDTWRASLQRAESFINPNRVEYYRLLKDVVLDAHLSSVIMQRKNAVLGLDYCLYNEAGEEVEDKEELLEQDWFVKLMDYALDSLYYGFSLVSLGEVKNYKFNNLTLVPRQYVKPELNIVVKNTSDLTGIEINDPRYYKWNILFCKDVYDLGLLAKAAPLVLWKKNALGFWSEHTEKFGQPMRIGKTDTNDERQLQNMEDALRNMGSSFWAVMDRDDSIDLVTSNFSGINTIYENLIKTSNDELSKLILGQTGTTDEKSYSGSATVHQKIFEEIIEADKKYLEYQINNVVLPILSLHGFGLDGLKFEFKTKEAISKEDQAKIDSLFLPYMKFDKEYLETTYGFKIDDSEPMEGGSEKKSLTNLASITNNFKCEAVSNLYSSKCEYCYTNEITEDVLYLFSQEDKQRFYDGIQSGIYTRESLPVWMYEAIALAMFLEFCKSWGYNSIDEALKSKDRLLIQEYQRNIYYFAGAKVFNLVDTVLSNDITKDNVYNSFNLYNEDYLNAEYSTVSLIGLSAYNWLFNIESNNGYKYLQYVTKRDDRVRPSHQTLDGIIKPIDSDFWNTYLPPNGWFCRCKVNKLKSGNVSDTSNFNNPNDVLDYFLFNPGKDKVVFNTNHPYFNVGEYKELALNNFNLPIPA